MRDFTLDQLQHGKRLPDDTWNQITNCLTALASDSQHNIHDRIVEGLTFKQLLQTLLSARDLIEHMQQNQKM